mgnify:CR=1 FL=1
MARKKRRFLKKRILKDSDRKLASIILRSIVESSKPRLSITETEILYSGKKGSRAKYRVMCRALLCIKLLEHLEKVLILKDISTLLGFDKEARSTHSMLIFYKNKYKEYNPLDSWNVEFFILKDLLNKFLSEDFEYYEYLLSEGFTLEEKKDGTSIFQIHHNRGVEVYKPEIEKSFPIERFKEAIQIDQYGDESSGMRIESLSKMLVDLFDRQKIKHQRYKYYKNKIPVSVIKIFLESQKYETSYIEEVVKKLDKPKVKIF